MKREKHKQQQQQKPRCSDPGTPSLPSSTAQAPLQLFM